MAATADVVVVGGGVMGSSLIRQDGPVPVIPGAGTIDEAAVAQAGRAIGGGKR